MPAGSYLWKNYGYTTPALSGNSFGPELGFLYGVSSLYQDMYAVKVAYPGAGIDSWVANPHQAYSNYWRILDGAHQALADAGPDSYIAGFFWLQGETDAKTLDTAQSYATKLTDLITLLRADLGIVDLPTFIGRITTKTYSYTDVVRQAQADVCSSVANTYLVDLDAAAMRSDGMHYTDQGYLDIGTWYADAYVTTLAQPTPVPASAFLLAPALGLLGLWRRRN